VAACPIISFSQANNKGITLACISDGFSKPFFSKAESVDSEIHNFLKDSNFDINKK
jgi:hypothetical protein